MNELPYELSFMHKFNLHKWLGLDIDDDDLRSIARIYGVKLRELKKIEASFNENVSKLTQDLSLRFHIKSQLDTPCNILAFGDSITSDRESWVKILRLFWKNDKTRRIIDCSISGRTTASMIDHLYESVFNQPFEYEWVVIFVGTNDTRELDDDAHISQISLEEYRLGMEYIIKSFQKRNKKVVNVTIPYGDTERFQKFKPDGNWKYDQKRTDKTNEVIRDLSKRYGTKIADLAKSINEYDGDVLTPDGIHLNGNGQTLLCELLLPILP